MRILRKLVYVLCLLGVWLSLTGCHTIEGVGEDIAAGGRALQRAAE